MPERHTDGFRHLLWSEWTKLRTAPGVGGSLLAVGAIIVAVAAMISSGSPGTYDDRSYVDEFRFVHRTMHGDGSLVARVRAQSSTHPWAMAGLMVKQSLTSGAPYAALLLTPGHGVRMQADFTTDIAGSKEHAPTWLKLSRAGETITGYESVDGEVWIKVGKVTMTSLPAQAEVGIFVTSPGMTRIMPMRPTLTQVRPSTATFDAVRLTPDAPQPLGAWTGQQVRPPAPSDGADRDDVAPPGESGVDGTFTVTGSGDIIGQSNDGSRIIASSAGSIFALLVVVALGSLAVTSEYRWGTIRVTLAACPGRGRVLAAKALVVTLATFATGLLATLLALLVTQPLLRHNGYEPPVYPDPSLSEPAVLRIVLGTAALLAVVALFSLGVGAVVRHSSTAITVAAASIILPVFLTPLLPPSAGFWLRRLLPTAGLSLQQFREIDDTLLLPWAGQPWAGFAVSCAYAAVAVGVGYWLMRRRDA